MPTTTASGLHHPDTHPDLDAILRATKRHRSVAAEEVVDRAIRNPDFAYRQVLAQHRTDYPSAPASTIVGWTEIDPKVMRAKELLENAKLDLAAIEAADHRSMEPSKVETAVARLDCSRRERSWSRFVRSLEHETRRRHALRRRQQSTTRATGREARPSTSTRTQGSRRTTSATGSRSSGDDSGSSGDPDPSGLAQTGRETQNEHRYCRGCGLRLVGYAPQARDHSPACTTRWRRRGKVAAEPVDGVEYGPGCQSQAEIQQAIRRNRQQVTYRYQQVTNDTNLDTVLELVELATSDRREAWVQGGAELAARHDYDLAKLWEEVRERRRGMGDPVYRRQPAGRLHG